MDEVQTVGVDERDNNWEHSHPRFRVYLHGSGQSSTYGWTDTYDVTGISQWDLPDLVWALSLVPGVTVDSITGYADAGVHSVQVDVETFDDLKRFVEDVLPRVR